MIANKINLQNNLTIAHETESAIIQLQENQIFITHHNNIDIVLKHVVEESELILKLIQGNKKSMIVDIRNIKSIDREAREFYKKFLESYIVAVGIVVDSPISRMIGNIVIGFNRPENVSIKIFTTVQEAKKWTHNEFENYKLGN